MAPKDARAAAGYVLLSHLHVQLGKYKTGTHESQNLCLDAGHLGSCVVVSATNTTAVADLETPTAKQCVLPVFSFIPKINCSSRNRSGRAF